VKPAAATPDVALVHDYFVQDGGAEAVAIELARMFPDAPVHTTYFERGSFGDRLDAERIRPWRLRGILPPSPWFRWLLPAYLAHYSLLEAPARRLVLSNSTTFARAVRAVEPAIHIAYVHSPLRFAWDPDGYLAGSSFPWPARAGLRVAAPALRRWDRWAGWRSDVVVASSANAQERINRSWGRSSRLIHPPVDVDRIVPTADLGDFYLVATRLLAYKRVDLAVRAMAALDRELVVVGDGPERAGLERMAGPRTRFLGHVDRAHIDGLLARCRALIAPGIEDFGIVPVEAMAAGRPVVAFAAGGTLETVVDGRTGVLFKEASASALAGAIERLDSLSLDPAVARARAVEFDVSVFRERWRALLIDLELPELAASIERVSMSSGARAERGRRMVGRA
jgi:glycosyltransferase involved in cell wall biosynthesis